jgi:hypothetical protein
VTFYVDGMRMLNCLETPKNSQRFEYQIYTPTKENKSKYQVIVNLYRINKTQFVRFCEWLDNRDVIYEIGWEDE